MNAITRVLRMVLGMVFLGTGGSKLAGAPLQVETFDRLGLPAEFRRFIGGVEILGALGMLLGGARRGLTAIASLGIAGVLLGALMTHLREHDPISKVALPAALLGLDAIVGLGAARALGARDKGSKPAQG